MKFKKKEEGKGEATLHNDRFASATLEAMKFLVHGRNRVENGNRFYMLMLMLVNAVEAHTLIFGNTILRLREFQPLGKRKKKTLKHTPHPKISFPVCH